MYFDIELSVLIVVKATYGEIQNKNRFSIGIKHILKEMYYMKRIKVTIDKTGVMDVEALEGFVGTECHKEIQQLVMAAGGTVVASEDKPDAFMPENPDSIFVDNGGF
jgi:hypothetical protein